MPELFSGVLAPVVTPFDAALAPDTDRLVRHCRWLLSRRVGLAVFGTNSEANSMSVAEKCQLLERLTDAGIDPRRMMPGTGACALSDAVTLTRRAVELGCGGVLMLPPFYYKGVSDEGLFRWYSEVIERVGSNELRVYLYHIPPVAQVGISLDLIGRLLDAWPGVIAGIKDSSGDWANTQSLLKAGRADFRVFAGSEAFLLRTMRAGGAGCISAVANIAPSGLVDLYQEWRAPDADARQATVNELRNLLQRYPMIPALKAAIAHHAGDPQWRAVRPPLVPLDERQRETLIDDLQGAGFVMSGLVEA